MSETDFVIVGAGLAGCECALTLAAQGFKVTLYEQKPDFRSDAHVMDGLAELVCSNSFRSNERTSGIGLLKNEMRALGSSIMACADQTRVAAGKALAVDRVKFSQEVERRVRSEKAIKLISARIDSLDDPRLFQSRSGKCVICAGPLISDELAQSLAASAGAQYCHFYDAIAPIIWTDSVNKDIVFQASRYEETGAQGDYLNCPMTRDEYTKFYTALLEGQTFSANGEERHFEGCMPIEALAERGERTLVFGPMKPVGLTDPRTGKRPWAVLQLRPESSNLETCNLVGCQTKLLQKEQQRIFRLIPGLEKAEFVRYGSMHRNTYINAPEVLATDLSLRKKPAIHCAGQLAGVEGYVESAACGLWLGLLLGRQQAGLTLEDPPAESALGGLIRHLRRKVKNFQPSNAHFGLMPEFAERIPKKTRKERYAVRAEKCFQEWLFRTNLLASGQSR